MPEPPLASAAQQRVGRALALVITVLSGALGSCDVDVRSPAPESVARAAFERDGLKVEVGLLGQFQHSERFGPWREVGPDPVDPAGAPEGEYVTGEPVWLEFEYRIGAAPKRRVLVARRPIMRHVSWDAIARAGAALGDDSPLRVGDGFHVQNATIRDLEGRSWRVRLMACGRSTAAHYSEWNLLIGGIHQGDMDFVGPGYGWYEPPFADEDLHVGHDGSLTWCQESRDKNETQRVARGYFQVSRFHAADRHLATDRLYWRPVLELEPMDTAINTEGPTSKPQWEAEVSPDQVVRFFGTVTSEELFGADRGINDEIRIPRGVLIDEGRPDWLHFEDHGRTLLIAARPVLHSVSWIVIAQMGAALGDGSILRLRDGSHAQNREVSDLSGRRYRVRLLRCGGATVDPASEWNRLIGGVHQGDGDFVRRRDGLYGWVADPMSDRDLHIGEEPGSATWCMERVTWSGHEYAVNRGYLTVSRFHMTNPAHMGTGFGWRPVLERIDKP